MRALSALLLVLVPSVAFAEPTIEILDRGGFTEVIAHGVKSTKTTITPARQRLEIPLAGISLAKRVVPKADPTIQLAEIDNESHVLSVKLTMERADVKTLVKSAQAMQIGDDLHLLFPNKLPADGVVVMLPEPTLTAAAPAPVLGPVLPVIAPAAIAAVKPEAAKLDDKKPDAAAAKTEAAPAPASAPEAKRDAAPAAKSPDVKIGKAPDPNAAPAKVGMPEEPGGQTMTYGALALALIGSIYWLVKKRKGSVAGAPALAIEVVAQKSLGGKARVVWLTAGGRDMIVAVTAQQVRMLGQWPHGVAADKTKPKAKGNALTGGIGSLGKKRTPETRFAEGTDPGMLVPAHLQTPEPESDLADAPAAITPSSPAIQGLMRLRARTVTSQLSREKRESVAAFQVNEDVATDDMDADAEWAKEILTATGRAR